jgi:homogentisate 1,2-dioxygenase
MFTLQGFGDVYSLLYHVSPPTDVLQIEATRSVALREWLCDSHRHHLFDTGNLNGGGDFFAARKPLLYNEDIVVSVAAPASADDTFYRNAGCDEFICVGTGRGSLETPFGSLAYGPGDMIVVPRGTLQQWVPESGSPHRLLILESKTTITPAARYLSRLGQFSFHSPVCERDFRAPQFREPRIERGRFKMRIKLGDGLTDYYYGWHPFDVIGWDGYLYPYAINMRDFEPVTRRIHTMPDEQQIFETRGAAICCLVSRLLDYHPKAIPAPPYHASVDVDELVFNMAESFMGWTRPSLGVMTFHPRGIIHGPKPGSYEASIGMKEFDGTAIMVDTFKPLRLTRYAQECDDPTYPVVWREPQPEPAASEK